MASNPVQLPRLPQNWQDQPQLFETYWDNAMSSIEKTLNAILSIPEIEAALVAVAEATEAAQDAADNANAAAGSLASENSIQQSFVLQGSFAGASPLESDSAGNVTIKAHTRRYGDTALNPDVNLAGDTIATGLANPATGWVYYVDATRNNTNPAMLFTTDPAPPPVQTGDTHVIGQFEIPAAGTSDGGYVKPPGFSGQLL